MAPRHRFERRAGAGFTLIELILVMGILVIVLTATYRIIIDCLEADRTIDKLTLPEKIGEGIMSLLRQDISGALWRNLGTRVFFVEDNGEAPEARDSIKLLSTVEPTPLEEMSQGSTVQVSELRTITGIWYYLRPNQGVDGVATHTLYRKEIVDFADVSPLEAPGQNYEVYDKVAYLSIKCYDPLLDEYGGWRNDWDSEVMIQAEQSYLESSQPADEGVAKVTEKRVTERRAGASSTRSQNPLLASAPGVDPESLTGGPEVLPPAAVPTAVRIEIGIYAAQGNRIERNRDGTPILKTYATVVPILTAHRIRIEVDQGLDSGEGEGEGGAEDGGVAGGGQGGGDIPMFFGTRAPGGDRGGPGSRLAGGRPGGPGGARRGGFTPARPQGPQGAVGGPRGARPGGGRAPVGGGRAPAAGGGGGPAGGAGGPRGFPGGRG